MIEDFPCNSISHLAQCKLAVGQCLKQKFPLGPPRMFDFLDLPAHGLAGDSPNVMTGTPFIRASTAEFDECVTTHHVSFMASSMAPMPLCLTSIGLAV